MIQAVLHLVASLVERVASRASRGWTAALEMARARQREIHGFALGALCAITAPIYIRSFLPHLMKYPVQNDFAQDYLGAWALLNPADELYPIIGPAVERLGFEWEVIIRSTHPPTAFLLALPFSVFPYRLSLILV
jgi:hypothetical protein